MSKSPFITPLVFLTLTLFFISTPGCDRFQTLYSEREKIYAKYDRLRTLVEDGNTTQAVAVANGLINQTADVSNMLIRKTASERIQAVFYVEIRYGVAITIADHLFDIGSHDNASKYHAIAEQTTRLTHKFKLRADTADSRVLWNHYDEGYNHFENGNKELARETWQNGLDYAAEFENDIIGATEDFYWQRGNLYQALGFVNSTDNFKKEAATLYQQAGDSYLKGKGSSHIGAEGLLDLQNCLSTAIDAMADDPKYKLAKIQEYICRSEPFEDAILMGSLYSNLASWYENYGDQALAGKWYDKSAESYRTNTDYTEEAFYAFIYKVNTLLLQGKLEEADTAKLDADKLLLNLRDHDTTAITNARNQVRLLEADIAFANGRDQEALAAYAQVARHQGYSSDNFHAVWQRINSLIMLIALEPQSEERKIRLTGFEQALIDAETFSMTQAETDDLKITFDWAELTLKKPFWFETFPKSATNIPEVLTLAPLFNLYYWHESAFYRGDWLTEERVLNELFRRGVGERSVMSWYELYDL